MNTERTIGLGGLVLVVTALFSGGFHHWDEHFQVLEFAAWKLGTTPAEALPWEFEAKLRPGIQPLLVVVMYKTHALFGTPDPFLLAMSLRLLTALLFYVGMVTLVRGQLRNDPTMTDPTVRRWYLFLSFFLWMVVYNAVRFSSEGLSAALFLLGYGLLVHGSIRTPLLRHLAVGLLLGLAFLVRYQVGFMIGGLLAWTLLVRRDRHQELLYTLAGLIAMIGLGIVVDRWFYGTWTLTLWTYFEQNILAGKASSFGTEPWWDYMSELFVRAVPPFSLLFLVPPLLVFVHRWRHPLTWSVLPFLLVHMVIGHKEIRFLFPLLGLLPLLTITGLVVIHERWWPQYFELRGVRIAARIFAAVHVALLLVIMLKPADDQVALYRSLYRQHTNTGTLVHDGEHPYHRVAAIHFYRRPELQIMALDDQGEPPVPAPFLYVTRQSEAPPPHWGRSELVYSSFPAWVMHFNVGGWVERTDRWSVYAVGP